MSLNLKNQVLIITKQSQFGWWWLSGWVEELRAAGMLGKGSVAELGAQS